MINFMNNPQSRYPHTEEESPCSPRHRSHSRFDANPQKEPAAVFSCKWRKPLYLEVQRNPLKKEELYDRILQIKGEVNTVKAENVKLKTKMQQMQDNLQRKPAEDQPYLVASLKQQIADLKSQLRVKDEQLEFIKQRLKFTKLSEMEIELKVAVDECTRLRRMLTEAMEELANNRTRIR